MKRALTLTLTVGLIAALALLGAAGTAAACTDDHDTTAGAQDIEEDAGDTQEATSVSAQYQEVDQNNIGVQQAEAGTGGDVSDIDFGAADDDNATNDTNASDSGIVIDTSGGDNATVSQSMDQSNSNTQTSTAVSATLDEFDLAF